jgi:hypothetical protein
MSASNSSRAGNRWPLLVASVYLAGYVFAVLPPVLVDPLIKSHVSFPGGRHYEGAWRAALFAIVVALTTWLLAKRGANPIVLGLPLVAGTISTNILVLPQEVPHDHVLFVTTVWTCVCATWVWIAYSADLACQKAALGGEATAEYVKEQASFFRTLAFGLVGAFLGLLVTALVAIHVAGGNLVSDKSEAFLLHRLTDGMVAVFALLLLCCPVQEALAAWRRVSLLLLPVNMATPPDRRLEPPGRSSTD